MIEVTIANCVDPINDNFVTGESYIIHDSKGSKIPTAFSSATEGFGETDDRGTLNGGYSNRIKFKKRFNNLITLYLDNHKELKDFKKNFYRFKEIVTELKKVISIYNWDNFSIILSDGLILKGNILASLLSRVIRQPDNYIIVIESNTADMKDSEYKCYYQDFMKNLNLDNNIEARYILLIINELISSDEILVYSNPIDFGYPITFPTTAMINTELQDRHKDTLIGDFDIHNKRYSAERVEIITKIVFQNVWNLLIMKGFM